MRPGRRRGCGREGRTEQLPTDANHAPLALSATELSRAASPSHPLAPTRIRCPKCRWNGTGTGSNTVAGTASSARPAAGLSASVTVPGPARTLRQRRDGGKKGEREAAATARVTPAEVAHAGERRGRLFKLMFYVCIISFFFFCCVHMLQRIF